MQELYSGVVHEDGFSGDVAEQARSWIVAPHFWTMDVEALLMPGYDPGPQPASVTLETSTTGKSWTKLLEFGVIGAGIVAGTAELPEGAQLRLRWKFTPQDSRAPWLIVRLV